MLQKVDRFIGVAVFVFVLIAYFQLFKFNFVPFSLRVMLQVVAVGLMLFLIIIRFVYEPEKKVSMNFSGLILILIIGAIPSYFVANSFHNQSIQISAFANRMIWFYMLMEHSMRVLQLVLKHWPIQANLWILVGVSRLLVGILMG